MPEDPGSLSFRAWIVEVHVPGEAGGGTGGGPVVPEVAPPEEAAAGILEQVVVLAGGGGLSSGVPCAQGAGARSSLLFWWGRSP